MLRVSRAGRVVRARGAGRREARAPGAPQLLLEQALGWGSRPGDSTAGGTGVPPTAAAGPRGFCARRVPGQPGQLLRPLLGQHCLPSQTAQPDRALEDARTRHPRVLFSPLAFDPVLSVFLALVFFQMIL